MRGGNYRRVIKFLVDTLVILHTEKTCSTPIAENKDIAMMNNEENRDIAMMNNEAYAVPPKNMQNSRPDVPVYEFIN
jgi:hypothetical protein